MMRMQTHTANEPRQSDKGKDKDKDKDKPVVGREALLLNNPLVGLEVELEVSQIMSSEYKGQQRIIITSTSMINERHINS